MKNSILLTVAILALGAAPAFFMKKQLATLRADSQDLLRQAHQLGIEGAGGRLSAGTRPSRGQHARHVTSLAREIAAQAAASGASEGEPDAETMPRTLDLIRRLGALDVIQLRQLIAELRDGADEQNRQARARWLSFALLILADDQPQAAIAAFDECADWLGTTTMGKQVLVSALGNWAQSDPLAAVAWLEKNTDKHLSLRQDINAVDALLAGAARHDPQLAFRLLDRLGAQDPEAALRAIMATAEDGTQHGSAVLAALRSHLDGIQDAGQRAELRGKALESLATGLSDHDFSTITKWLSAENFTADELGDFAGGLNYYLTTRDSGRWIEWLAARLPAEQLADPVREIVSDWTQVDYVAAGTWLGSLADGPAKTSAVEAYAEAVAEYEPQVAEQWALTLPQGASREAALRAIHENWPTSDPAGAEAFARKYRIEDQDFSQP